MTEPGDLFPTQEPVDKDLSTFQMGLKDQKRHVETLLLTNSCIYKDIPITLTDAYRTSKTPAQLEAASSLLLGIIEERAPLLEFFPGLKVAFENKPVVVEFNGKRDTVLPDMSYSFPTISISERSQIADSVFDHEGGHHIHTAFTDADNEELLRKHEWNIIEQDGTIRLATRTDLLAIMGDGTDDDQTITGSENERYSPKWEYIHPGGVKRKGYRYSNPKEMVAEVVADNMETMLQLIKGEKMNGQRQIIEYILEKL